LPYAVWYAISENLLVKRMKDAMEDELIASHSKRLGIIVSLLVFTLLAQATYGEQPAPAGSGPAASEEDALLAPTSSMAERTPSVIHLDRPVHFTTPEGGPLVVPVGTYEVKASGATALQLNPEGGGAFLIEALTMHHPNDFSEAVALSIPAGEDMHHVVLLLPQGQGLDAVGSYSAVRPRGWNPTPVLFEFIAKALKQKEKPIRKDEKKGGH
jgi:hypothetical protein